MITADELLARADRLAAAGEREGAAWATYRAASLLSDSTQAATALDRALTLIDGIACDRLRGSIAALAAELALDAADVEAGVQASREAERCFQRAGDARGFLAVWTARAMRALRTGDAEAGITMAQWMLPWIDEVAEPAPRIWLRLYAAEHLLARDYVEFAVAWALDVLDLAGPGTDERLVAAELLVRALATLDRRDDGIRAALTELERTSGADALRGRLYQTVGLFLGESDPALARACRELAAALDAPAPPPPPPRAVISALLG